MFEKEGKFEVVNLAMMEAPFQLNDEYVDERMLLYT